MRPHDADPDFQSALEGQLPAGEQLVSWCQCFEPDWYYVDRGPNSWYEAHGLGWYWVALTNINLRLGNFRQVSLGLFKGNAPLPEVASVQTFAIKDIVAYEFLTEEAHWSFRTHLKKALGDWPKRGPEADITTMTLSLPSGESFDFASPFDEFLELAQNLDAARIKAANEASGPTPERAAQFSVADELGKIADLRDRGILSDEEFEQQKAKLLESD